MGIGISSKEVAGDLGKCCLHEMMGRNRLGMTPDGASDGAGTAGADRL